VFGQCPVLARVEPVVSAATANAYSRPTTACTSGSFLERRQFVAQRMTRMRYFGKITDIAPSAVNRHRAL
jgi:hypothetical protein